VEQITCTCTLLYDDKFTPTTYETPNTPCPSPPQQPARSGSHRHGDTHYNKKKGRARGRTASTDVVAHIIGPPKPKLTIFVYCKAFLH